MTTLINIMEKALDEINEISTYVEEWRADDGGLTMAASDMLALVANAKKAIQEGDASWASWDDLFDCTTGTEEQVLEIVVRYFDAKRKAIEEIAEERLADIDAAIAAGEWDLLF